MDAVIFILLAVFIAYKSLESEAVKQKEEASVTEIEDVTREAKLNDMFYEDPNAFTEISSILGFPKRS